jgi:hypothetical protein
MISQALTSNRYYYYENSNLKNNSMSTLNEFKSILFNTLDFIKSNTLSSISLKHEGETTFNKTLTDVKCLFSLHRYLKKSNFKKSSPATRLGINQIGSDKDEIIIYNNYYTQNEIQELSTNSNLYFVNSNSNEYIYEQITSLLKSNPYCEYYFNILITFNNIDDLMLNLSDSPEEVEVIFNNNQVFCHKDWSIINYNDLNTPEGSNTYHLTLNYIPLLFLPDISLSSLNLDACNEELKDDDGINPAKNTIFIIYPNQEIVCTNKNYFLSYLTRQNFDYKILPFKIDTNINETCLDLILFEDVNSKDYLNIDMFDKIIFYLQGKGTCYSRDIFLKETQDITKLSYKCDTGDISERGIRYDEIEKYKSRPITYFSMTTSVGQLYIDFDSIHLIENYNYFEFDIVQENRKTGEVISKDAIDNLNFVSGDHCQHGTNKNIYKIVPRINTNSFKSITS